MKITEFLKPNKFKIKIFLLLVFVSGIFLIYLTLYYTGFGPYNPVADCCSNIFYETRESCRLHRQACMGYYLNILIPLIIYLMINYIISCLINLYFEVKKK